MKLVQLFACVVLICGSAVSVFASESRVIGWDDLAPTPLEYDNPFSQLEPDQLNGLRKLLRLQQAESDDGDVAAAQEAAALRAKLEDEGLNVEWLFEQRRIIMETRQRIAAATNGELIGESVRLPGYLLPLEMKDRKAIEFLLVPTVGACIHTPAPPANQIVHVRYPDGVVIEGLYTPIWISGKLLAENKVETVRYVDGESRVEMSYVMNADVVEPY